MDEKVKDLDEQVKALLDSNEETQNILLQKVWILELKVKIEFEN